MSNYDLVSPKAAAAIRALLPGKAWHDVSINGPAPVTTAADWAMYATPSAPRRPSSMLWPRCTCSPTTRCPRPGPRY